jgi:hypothetical protein
MFAYRLAKDLGMRVLDVLEMSTIEFQGWVVFYKMEAEENKKQMQKMRSR